MQWYVCTGVYLIFPIFPVNYEIIYGALEILE